MLSNNSILSVTADLTKLLCNSLVKTATKYGIS